MKTSFIDPGGDRSGLPGDLEARVLSTVRSGALYPLRESRGGESALAAWEQFDVLRRPDPQPARVSRRSRNDAGPLFPLPADA